MSLGQLARLPQAARRFLAGALLLELGHAFLWALQNLYVRAAGHGEADAGWVLSAAGLGVVVSTIPSASIYDRLGPRRSLMLGTALFATAMTGLAWSESLPALLCWSALQGMGFTLHRVVAAPFIVSLVAPAERTRLFQLEFATHTVASTVGLAGAGLLAGLLERDALPELSALRWTLVAGALASALSLHWYRRLPGDARPLDPTAVRRGTFAILRRKHWHLWSRLALPHLLIGLGAGLTIPFINVYFTDRFQLDKGPMGLVMAATQVTMTVGVLATPALVSRIGLLRATLLTETLSLPFFLVLALTTNLQVAIAASVFRAALMNLSHPLWRNLMMEVTPDEWRAAVNGVSMLAWNLGWAASNHWGGLLIESGGAWAGTSDGYTVPMLLTLSLYVLAIVLEACFFWDRRQLGIEPQPAPEPADT